jgi:hypothetical protein
LAAIDYYAAISADLGERFYAEIERLMKEVCAAPRRFRKYDPPADPRAELNARRFETIYREYV